MEVVAGLLEAVELAPPHPFGGHVGRDRQEHDQVGPDLAHRPLVDAAHLVEREAAAITLVGERGVHRAVADDMATGGQRGTHDLGHVLGAVGGDDQRLGAIVEIEHGRVVQDRPQPLTDRRAAGLTRDDGADRPRRDACAGALATSLAPSSAM